MPTHRRRTGATGNPRREAHTERPVASARTDATDWLATLARAGNGEMGRRIAATDWAQHPIGPAHAWPQALKATVKTLLASRYPMILLWGYDELIQFYNDAYIGLIGAKHPGALGRSIRETQAESWSAIGPMIYEVMSTGTPNWVPAQMLPLNRAGYLEESYFSLSYSAVDDDTGAVRGMLCVCSEVTQQVLGERRLKVLHDLSARAGSVRSVEATCADIAAVIGEHRLDVPFAAIYLRAGDDGLRLHAAMGVNAGEPPCAHTVSLAKEAKNAAKAWPISRAAAGEIVLVDNVADHAEIAGGPWHAPVHSALLLPLVAAGNSAPLGVFVAGVSPNRAVDHDYRAFFKLLAGQISISLRNAHAYEEEHRRAELLAEIDRAKTDFFSNVSHEFRTPLTLMLGPLEDMLSDNTSEVRRDAAGTLQVSRAALESAYRNGTRLLKLVNTLLDFSRVEAGRVQAAYEPTDLAATTRELASAFQSAVERAGLRLSVDIQPLSTPIHVDRDMWEKIVLNLISNAFKFTFKGGIEVALQETDAAAVLQVRDTGTGIPPADVAKVFARFHRVQGAKSRSFEGSGIGLALVQELVRLHGGSVTVTSAVGIGSTFTVTMPKGTAHLPAEKVDAERRAQSTRVAAHVFTEEALRWLPDADVDNAAATAPHPRRDLDSATDTNTRDAPAAHILLVDDNADMRAYVSRLLSPRYSVSTAPNGRAALAAIAARTPDLILSDVMMPEMDGFALLKALRADSATQRIPFILLSARAGQEAVAVGIETGADDYLVKPFSAKELLARVRQHLRMARLRHDYEAEQALRLQLEEGERRFRQLAEAVPDIVWIANADGAVSYYNRRWYDYTGNDWAQTRAWGWRPVVHPQDIERTLKDWATALASGAPYEREHRLRRVDGAYRWFLTRAIPVHDTDGAITEWFGTSTDIQEQKQAIQIRDDFLSIASHELKTPITSLRLQLQMTRRKVKPEAGVAPSPAKIAQSLDLALGQTDRLIRLAEDLLDVSRMQAGRLELARAPIDVTRLIAELVTRLRPEFEAARCTPVLAMETRLTGHWDRARIDQVITNLLTNAIKYAPGGPIRIAARRDRDTAQITVHDSGLGVPLAERSAIFERFERGNPARKASGGGIGLGLFICKQIVEAHGGRIWVEGEAGAGANFRVDLPLEPPARPTDAAQSAADKK